MPRTGRPREFDVEAAVAQAMLAFWEHGYEATSLARLKEAMGGLSTASFYAAFGSKEQLFRRVLARYLATHGQVMATLRDEALLPREAIEKALRQSAAMQTDADHPSGCLVVLGAATVSPENAHLRVLLADERSLNRRALCTRITQAVATGELQPSTPVEALTTAFDGFLVGLTTQARDGVGVAALDVAVTQIMALWDIHAARKGRQVVFNQVREPASVEPRPE